MKNKLKLIFAFIAFYAVTANAQVGIGTTTPNASSALDITSNKGMLIPRMDSFTRNQISSPANGLLIYNTTNNSFEVYKTTCTCWVTVADGGNTPAQSIVNSAPTAFNLNYIGKAIVGQSLQISYIYNDAQNDPQGLTGFQWQEASTNTGSDATNISGANTASYTPTIGNVGRFLRAVITPRASVGVLNGATVFGSWVQVEGNTIPTVNNLLIPGTPAQGTVLAPTYTFAGGSGIENIDPLTGSTYTWEVATTSTGIGRTNAPLYSSIAYSNTFTPQSDLLGRFIRVGIRAKDSNGLQAINFVFSDWIGPISESLSAMPVVSNIIISPAPAENLLLTATYTYSDINGDPEGASSFQWFRADNASGLNQVVIAGATNLTYTPTVADNNKYLGIGITPLALTGGVIGGNQVIYYHPNAVLPVASFTFTASAIRQLPFFALNRAMNVQNNIQVEINVTSTGGIVFSSNIVNGYSFSANYTATTTGVQWVTLNASGTQIAYNIAGDAVTITGVGTTTLNKPTTVLNSISGAGLTAYSNGAPSNENFNNNGQCVNAILSAGYTSGTCSGSVTVGSNSYNLVHINGQCWMQTNLKEAPTAPCASQSNTGCNIWLATTVADNGFWGYFNATTTDGTAGWGTTETISGEGLLYQWSAAMNGTTHERSRGACPIGWHIPSDCEWMYLEHGQGMSITSQTTNSVWRNTTGEGHKLRGSGGSFTNSSGFTALMAGRRASGGFFGDRNLATNIWSSTESGTFSAFRRAFASTQAGVSRGADSKATGFFVRCLRD